MQKKPLVIAIAIALTTTALSFTLAAEEGVTAQQKEKKPELVETEFD